MVSRTLSVLSGFLNYDFCPSFNQYVYWLKRPIGWLACAAFSSLMIGLFIGPQGFILMWTFLALIAIGFVWPWISLRSVSCEISFLEARTSEGKETVAQLTIRNSCPLPIYGLTVEGSFLQEIVDEDDLVAVGLEKVAGWCVSTFKWKLTPRKRGQLPANAPVIANGFPFGIIKCFRELEIEDKVTVWPASEKLEGKPKTFSSFLSAEETWEDRAGKDGETIGVREFRQGDSIRHVHWSKTAQRNRLIVRELQTCSREAVHIIVDLAVSSHSGNGGQSSFEWAIRTTASLCRQLHQHQFMIKLDCVGLPVSVARGTSNREGLEEILDFLALLPEFEQLRENQRDSPLQVTKAQFSPSSRLKFLVCTDRSGLQKSVTRDVKKIQIDCQGFGSEPTDKKTQGSRSQTVDSLVLRLPETAAADLKQGWNSEYSHGI
ncbi:MAG: DUF58 domain-containing protein [Planctomycetota bacterium]|nr:DUF58 domain-containing protein [Planctomycetota bacterium]